MFNKKSHYALNKKKPNAIVSQDAYGNIEELTSEHFDSEEEFRKWKAVSDEIYHEIENGDHVELNHTVSLHGLSDEAFAVLPLDHEMLKQCDRQQIVHLNRDQIITIRTILTERQFRRLWLHDALGWKETRIAELENISQAAVSISIKAARKKISKKFFSAGQNYL